MKNKKIVFVDDNPNDLVLYGAMLKSMQYEVLLINDPTIALSKINEFKPDIIFLDLNLGENISGLSLLKQIKRTNFKGTICILSGMSDSNIIHRSLENGANEYLLKPVYSNLLNNVIEHSDGNIKRYSKHLFGSC